MLSIICICIVIWLSIESRKTDLPTETRGIFLNSTLNRIAYIDYKKTRGYQHLIILQKARKNIQSLIDDKNQQITKVESQINSINQEIYSILYRDYCDKIILDIKQDIPILNNNDVVNLQTYCYNGKIDTLRNAYTIKGIGNVKQNKINNWIIQKKNEYPVYLNNHPEIKEEFEQKYAMKKRGLNDQIVVFREQLNNLAKLKSIIQSQISELSSISEMDFYHAQKTKNKIVPIKFFNGVFAPWEPMPTWFREVIEKYGG